MNMQGHEQEKNTKSTPKNAKLKRRLLLAAELMMYLISGVAMGFFLGDEVLMLIAFLPVLVPQYFLFRWLKANKLSHLYEKPEENQDDELAGEENTTPKTPPPRRNIILGYVCLLLQMAAGGLIGFSVFTLIFRFIEGYYDGMGRYFGMLGLAIIVLIVGIVLGVTGNAVAKKEFSDGFTYAKEEFSTFKKDIIFIETDERMSVIGYKAGYIAFWSVLAALLIFGGIVVVLPIENVNILTAGILGICIMGTVIYTSVMGYYSEKNFNAVPKISIPLKVTFFVLSLIPLGLTGLAWGINGLSSAGIAFFIAFAITSAILLVEAVMQAKVKKKARAILGESEIG